MLKSQVCIRNVRLLVALLLCAAWAQADPPKIIRVVRNMTWADGQVYGEAKEPISVLGALSVSGPSEVWFIEMHTTFASVEDLYESINFDQPAFAYQIASGAIAGTYVFVTPLESLKTFDDGLAKTPDGPRDPTAAEQKLASEVEISHEYLLFRIDPQNSYVTDDFAAGDPGFWNSRQPKH